MNHGKQWTHHLTTHIQHHTRHAKGTISSVLFGFSSHGFLFGFGYLPCLTLLSWRHPLIYLTPVCFLHIHLSGFCYPFFFLRVIFTIFSLFSPLRSVFHIFFFPGRASWNTHHYFLSSPPNKATNTKKSPKQKLRKKGIRPSGNHHIIIFPLTPSAGELV